MLLQGQQNVAQIRYQSVRPYLLTQKRGTNVVTKAVVWLLLQQGTSVNGGVDQSHVQCEGFHYPYRGYHQWCASCPLVLAAARGHADTVELLIKNGASLTATGNPHGWNALMAAILEHENDIALSLAKHMEKHSKGNTFLNITLIILSSVLASQRCSRKDCPGLTR